MWASTLRSQVRGGTLLPVTRSCFTIAAYTLEPTFARLRPPNYSEIYGTQRRTGLILCDVLYSCCCIKPSFQDLKSISVMGSWLESSIDQDVSTCFSEL